MKQPGMDSDFEAFRRERNRRRHQRNHPHRPQGNHEIWEELEASEANDLHDQIINAEVDDFFSDATRMAASIVKRVAENRKEELSAQLRREMEEFLAESIRHAHNLMMALPQDTSSYGQEILNASLRNLDVREIDEFRAAGTAQLADKHLGEDPFPSGVVRAVTKRSSAVAAEAESLTGASSEVPSPVEPQPVAELDSALAPLDCDTDTDTDTASVAGASGLEPGAEVRSLELPELAGAEDELITDHRLHIRAGELGLDVGGTAYGFEAGGFVDQLSGGAAIQKVEPSMLPPTVSGVHRAVGSTQPVVEDELPLAALYEGNGEECGARVTGDPWGADLQPPEPSNVESEPVTEPAPEPIAEESVECKQARIREALLDLVKQGIMTKEQARAAYLAQTKAASAGVGP